ncbi:hypothetical protein OSTOST_13260 [Ostertagia ostertagi]
MSNSRTLTPAHMKQAMMANRHFHFLADIFKEVAVPGRMGPEFDPNLSRQQMQLLQGYPAVPPWECKPLQLARLLWGGWWSQRWEDQDRALMPPPALPMGRARPVA